jgi:hypothetical protein
MLFFINLALNTKNNKENIVNTAALSIEEVIDDILNFEGVSS